MAMQHYGVIVLIAFVLIVAQSEPTFKEKVESAKTKTTAILKDLFDRWDIKNFPNFLRSVAMSHTSWEVLKLKFQSKILSAAGGSHENFVISFMGSSVTAGHDSPFNKSFPVLTGEIMGPALLAAGIQVISRNAAMGNNPCLPYDVCIKPFAGGDADIVHWEQGYNCFGSDHQKKYVFEQFVRQSLFLTNMPVVVFSDSATPNWKAPDCKGDPKPAVSDDEAKILSIIDTEAWKVVSEMNSNRESAGPWSANIDMFKAYKTAGIQMWKHDHYQSYKCHGPYVKDWGCCSASWHPSLLGHELRAAHYSYFWLLAFRDALNELSDVSDVAQKLQSVKKHIDSEHKHIPTSPLNPSDYADHLQCYTTSEPLYDETGSLFKLVIPSGDGKEGFKDAIVDDFVPPHGHITKLQKAKGYKDYKRMLYGNKDSSPLSLKIKVNKSGIGFLCTPPGNWGAYPKDFVTFWTVGTKVYLTEQVTDTTGFSFSVSKAKELPYVNKKPKDTQEVCVQFTDHLPAGDHVLTIVATNEKNIMISYLLLP